MMNNIYNNVSEKLNIPKEVVESAYISFWKYIRTSIKNIPLKEDLDIDNFNTLRTNFNIPSLGKLSCSYDRMIGKKRQIKYIKELKNED